jgi:hypothetical protein
MAGTVAVSSTASFTGGLLGDWSISYSSGASDLWLQSVTIDLGPSAGHLKFDTYSGAGSTFGSQTSEDIGNFGGTDVTTGLSGISATGQALDGGTLVTFSFLDFAPGDVFKFSADVDKPDPVLTPLENCSGLKNLALLACQGYNVGVTTANSAALLAAQTVGPNQMAGATVTFTFGGTNYTSTPIGGAFQPVTLQSILTGLAQGQGLAVFNTTADPGEGGVMTPEPACMATFGAGMGLLLALAGRRRRV